MKKSTTNNKRIAWPDAVRGIGAVLVSMIHMYSFLYIPVISTKADVLSVFFFTDKLPVILTWRLFKLFFLAFFFLSGWIFTYLFLKGHFKFKKIKDFVVFYIGRWIRIFWVLTILILSVFVLFLITKKHMYGGSGNPFDLFNIDSGQFFLNSMFNIFDIDNFAFVNSGLISEVQWSLFIEFWFYISFPIVISIAAKIKNIKFKYLFLILLEAIIYYLSIYVIPHSKAPAEIHLIIGMIAAFAYVDFYEKLKNKAKVSLIAGRVMIASILGYILLDFIEHDFITDTLALWLTWISFSLACSPESRSKFKSLIVNRFTIFLGKISYPYYLIHIVIVILVFEKLQLNSGSKISFFGNIHYAIATILISIALAYIYEKIDMNYRVVTNKVLELLWLKRKEK